MRREYWFIMLAIVGWALSAGLYFGTRAFAPDLPPPPPVTPPIADASAPAASSPGTPPSLMQWSPGAAQEGVIPDPTGHGFAAQLKGTALARTVAGLPAISFDGSGDNGMWHGQPQNCGLAVEKPLRQAFQKLSVEAWVRKERGGWMPVLYRDKWDEESSFGLYMEWNEGKAVFGHYGNDSGVQSRRDVQDGAWHHIVGTMGPAEGGGYQYRIYVDGQLDAEQLGSWAVSEAPATAGILTIACPNSTGAEHPFKGDLGPLALYDMELSPDQIKAHYIAQKPH